MSTCRNGIVPDGRGVGRVQRIALRHLALEGEFPLAGWRIGTYHSTEVVLRSLVERGFVEATGEGHVTTYRIADAGRLVVVP